MARLITSNRLTIVLGMGATGLSVARYLYARNQRFMVVDSRQEPPALATLAEEMPDVPVAVDGIKPDTLLAADNLVLSPGLSLRDPAVAIAVEAGIPVTGDIQLFVDEAKAPIIAISGSNGKSTVTALVGDMAKAAGKNVGVGGNLGTPALDLLADNRDLYVLELSSFQLELVKQMNAEVAAVLNISPDHLDRYPDLPSYHRAKHRIFSGVKQVVANRQDILTQPLVPGSVTQWSFGLDKPDFKGFGLVEKNAEPWLCFEFQPLMPLADVALKGRHNTANALAALALGHAAGLPMAPMLETLRTFKGLPHRCQLVAEKGGINWIDDSKATNVGAAVAAIESFASAGGDNLILIAGGQAKGQAFEPLAEVAQGRVRLAILIGEDAAKLADALHGKVKFLYATSMEAAVNAASRAAAAGDCVLLSPACASFDMFLGYQDRGRCFAKAVEALL